MMLFEWNSVRVGDAVVVHDDADLTAPLSAGVVRMVQTGSGTNDVAIALAAGGVVRPRRLAVHLATGRPPECWRCDVLAERQTHPIATTGSDADLPNS